MRTRHLRDASLRELRPLLEEEAASVARRSRLGFQRGACRRGGGHRAGNASRPHARRSRRRAQAYCYYMVDAGRVIVGSIYASSAHRGRGLEEALVDAVVNDARTERRAERGSSARPCSAPRAQRTGFRAAGLRGPRPALHAARPRRARCRPRRPCRPASACGPCAGTSCPWRPRSSTAATSAAWTPRSTSPTRRPLTCRTFVETLVLRSGCGRFDPEASRIAEGPRGAVGVLIASRLAASNGHVCQVSVCPRRSPAASARR